MDPTSSAGSREPGLLSEGTVVGDFRLVRELGRGGMGVVFLAEQISLRRIVALKVLVDWLSLRPEAVERFRREASIAARIRHPNIVQVYSVGEEKGICYFAMEYVDGVPLDAYVKEVRSQQLGGRGVVEVICGIGEKVAFALDEAHRAGIVHRDVKPGNILVRADGTPALTDFGIARDEALPSLTITGELAGTPYYLSPEQAMARRVALDHRTDVYSLGVTLYELLTERRPFEGRTVQEVLGKIISREAPNPREYNPQLPQDLVTIVMKCLEKDPDKRYLTAVALANDLRAFLELRPIVAKPPSAVERSVKWVRRNRALAAAVSSVLTVSLAGSLYWYTRPGTVELTSTPAGAVAWIDGEERGATPLRVDLSPGAHAVRLVKLDSDLLTFEESIIVNRNTTTRFDRALMSARGALRLASDPPGARLALVNEAGEETRIPSVTPTLVSTLAGDYAVRFDLEGFSVAEARVKVLPGGVETRHTQRWKKGEVTFDSVLTNATIDIFPGERIRSQNPIRTVALTQQQTVELPAGPYSLRVSCGDRLSRDFEGRNGVMIESGGIRRFGIWIPPFRRLFHLPPSDESMGKGCLLTEGDIDGDGCVEILTVSEGGRLRGISARGDEVFRFRSTSHGKPSHAWIEDLDLDGRPDVCFTTEADFLLAVRGDGELAWSLKLPGPANGLSVARLPGESRPRIFASVKGKPRILSFDNMGNPIPGDGPAALESLPSSDPARQLLIEKSEIGPDARIQSEIIADVDNDGSLNRVILASDGFVKVGPLTGEPARTVRVPMVVYAAAVGDLDANGAKEIVVNGQGAVLGYSSTLDTIFKIPSMPQFSAMVAVNFDRIPGDEVVASAFAGDIYVLGAGGVVRGHTQLGSDVVGLTAPDLNGDGSPEILAVTRNDSVIGLTVDQDLRFANQGAEYARCMIASDLDGDDRAEIVIGGFYGELKILDSNGALRAATTLTEKILDIVPVKAGARLRILALRHGNGEVTVVDGSAVKLWSLSDAGADKIFSEDLDGDGLGEIGLATAKGMIQCWSQGWKLVFERDCGSNVSQVFAAKLAGDTQNSIVACTLDGRLVISSFDGGAVRNLAIESVESVKRSPTARVPLAKFCAALTGDVDKGFQIVVATESGRILLLDGSGSVVKSTRLTDSMTPILNSGNLSLSNRAQAIFPLTGSTDAPRLAIVDGSLVRIFDGDFREEAAHVMPNRTMGFLPARFGSSGALDFVALAHTRPRAVVKGVVLQLPDAHEENVRCAAAGDLDGDGKDEFLVATTSGRVVAWDVRPDHPKIRWRQEFTRALDALGRGDLELADRLFSAALLRWFDPLQPNHAQLTFDRDQILSVKPNVASRRILATMDRKYGRSAAQDLEDVAFRVGQGEIDEANSILARIEGALRQDPALAARVAMLARFMAAGSAVDAMPIAASSSSSLPFRIRAVPKPTPEILTLARTLAAIAYAAVRGQDPEVIYTVSMVKLRDGDKAASLDLLRQAIDKCPKATSRLRDWFVKRLAGLTDGDASRPSEADSRTK